jgi:hypothetical protein
MQVTIDIYLNINGTRTKKGGVFQARREEDIPKIAHDFIKSTRRETGYYGHQSLIEKVILDGNKDITLQVKEIDAAPLPVWDLPW